MLRQAAFGGNRRLLKGGLHTHTTRSDGSGTPEQVMNIFAAAGYDFLALTDHNFYNYKNFAPETGIVVVPGMEVNMDLDPKPGEIHCFHTVVLGHAKEKGNPIEQDQRYKGLIGSTAADFQPVLDDYHAKNQLTIYCHPEWSGTPAREFEDLRGNFAMEIWNSGCAIENGIDTNAAYWDELLWNGQHISGVATDDGHAISNHANGWVCVNAEKELESILNALEAGAFYSSCGPEIYDFYVDNGKAVLECSPCREISFRALRTPLPAMHDEAGKLTHFEFECPDTLPYLRATVVDANGKRAWTNPIYFK